MVWKRTLIATTAIALSGCAAAVGAGVGAAAYAAYDEWDDDNNTFVSETEFRSGLAESDLFDEWDVNDSGFLEESEWNEGVADWTTDAETFAEWDLDGDARLTETEFGEGLFDALDVNDDAVIDEDEFDSIELF